MEKINSIGTAMNYSLPRILLITYLYGFFMSIISHLAIVLIFRNEFILTVDHFINSYVLPILLFSTSWSLTGILTISMYRSPYELILWFLVFLSPILLVIVLSFSNNYQNKNIIVEKKIQVLATKILIWTVLLNILSIGTSALLLFIYILIRGPG